MCFSLDLINFSGAQGLYRGRTCECVNALVSSRNANETSSWGDGNLADRGVIKTFSNFKNSCTFAFRKNGYITTKSKYNDH